MSFEEIGYEDVHWTYVTQDWIQKWAYVNLVKKLCVPQLGDKIFKYLDKLLSDRYFIHKLIQSRLKLCNAATI